MTETERVERDRLLDLLADDALGALAPADKSEIDFLLKRHRDVPRNALSEAVATIDLVVATKERGEPLPAMLRSKIRSTYRSPIEVAGQASRDLQLRRIYGAVYLAAAAVVLTAFLLLLRAPRDDSSDREFAQQKLELDRLVARAPDSKHWKWEAGSDPQGSGATVNGEVVWSCAEQRGFMIFHGLKHNDAKTERYQLWIFDKTRDERYPVDGGVFDCTANDAIVPISARVEVAEAIRFAVTVEKPCGVVVSDRSRIVALAGP